ncbi:MAG: aldo/keto reductase [Actinobacteria bacterium HGW-Actinobacteria-4]|nr:MAG: aldo/keto reductase [Actinobacteria bacterium HGW-Actinobacteria-4]
MTNTAFRLGTTENHLTPIALGAMNFGTQTPEDEARRILDHFITEVTPRYQAPDGTQARGMIDTADCYSWWDVRGEYGGHGESLLGRWFADAGTRDAVYLATKGTALIDDIDAVWDGDKQRDWSVIASHFVGASPTVLRESLAGSLERLGVDHIDLYYNHVDDRKTPLTESVGTFASFVAEGSIGAYGWSNVTTWRLAQIRAVAKANGWPQPAALQQQHSYLNRRAGLRHNSIVSDEQLDYLENYPDLQLVAYSPVLKGLFSDKSKRSGGYWAMDPYKGPDADARLAAVDKIAKATGATGNQVVLAWLMAAQSPRVLPLIGPRTFDQYLEAVEALDVSLTSEQLEELDTAGA